MTIEYVVMTKSKSGGTEAVTQIGDTSKDAREKVIGLGYDQVIWVSPDDENDPLLRVMDRPVG